MPVHWLIKLIMAGRVIGMCNDDDTIGKAQMQHPRQIGTAFQLVAHADQLRAPQLPEPLAAVHAP